MAIPPGFAEVTYRHAALGSTHPMCCVWGHSFPQDTIGPETTAQFLHDYWGEVMMACMSRDITLVETVCRIGQDGGPPTVQTAAGGNFVGLLNSAMLPNNTATLIKKQTALGGRRGRGRCFLPPVGEEQSGGGRLAPDIVAVIGGNVAGWVQTLNTGDFGPVLLHESPGPTIAPTPITGASCDPLLATQRRRLR